MVIPRIMFPIYDVLIYFSLIVGSIYIYIYIYISVGNKKFNIKQMIVFFLLFLLIPIILGKIYTMLEQPGSNFFSVGVTGYGGLIGVILSAFIYYFLYKNKSVLKYAIISLPLTYSFAKLACFFNGCCIGIPYDGPFAVIYPFLGNKSYFPIQLVETITFIFVFLFCNSFQKHKNISYITLIVVFLVKFLLDFLRYGHIYNFLSNNQIMSLVLLFIVVLVYFIKRYKKIIR